MQYIQEIKQTLAQARQKSYQAINSAMVEAYWNIGRKIVLEEQNGNTRADYGKEILKNLSIELSKEFGKGFSERSLREYRQFYFLVPDFEIWRTAYAILNWSHFQRFIRISDSNVRNYYLIEAVENRWCIRTLYRNISTFRNKIFTVFTNRTRIY